MSDLLVKKSVGSVFRKLAAVLGIVGIGLAIWGLASGVFVLGDRFFEVRGSVADCASGEGLAGVNIRTELLRGYGEEPHSVTSGPSGEFHVHLNEPPSSAARLSFDAAGYETRSRVFDPPPAHGTTVHVCLEAGVEQMWLGGWLDRNEPIVRKYLLTLDANDIGHRSAGVALSDGTNLFADDIFLGKIEGLPHGVHGFLFERGRARFSCIWSEKTAKAFSLPTCANPNTLEHEVISRDVYTYGDVHPGGNIVIIWCVPDAWLASDENALGSTQR